MFGTQFDEVIQAWGLKNGLKKLFFLRDKMCFCVTKYKPTYFGFIEGLDEMTWHTMDAPHYIVILEGMMELEVGDGTKRRLKAGDILLAEDTTGQGHILRGVNKQRWNFLIAPLK